MKRRDFIQLLVAASLAPAEALANFQRFVDGTSSKKVVRPSDNARITSDEDEAGISINTSTSRRRTQGRQIQNNTDTGADNASVSSEPPVNEEDIKDYLSKIRAPDTPHHGDIYASPTELQVLRRLAERFRKIVSLVGDGNFCVMGFDDALNFAQKTSKVEAFGKDETDLLEQLFFHNAHDYGFYGEKQLTKLTDIIDRHDIYKVPYSGNFLFKGESLAKFELVRKDMGNDLILTSGIRGMVKQFYLFISKALRFDGNLSLASRSLAPPGYSYHATGDFDVGQRGFGPRNFTENFLDTSIYKNLSQRGYVQYRYGRDNLKGVRFEPWHIKV